MSNDKYSTLNNLKINIYHLCLLINLATHCYTLSSIDSYVIPFNSSYINEYDDNVKLNPEEYLDSYNVITIENDIIIDDSNECNDIDKLSKYKWLKGKKRCKREVHLGRRWPTSTIAYVIDEQSGFCKFSS